jgi:large subunit ribosomal protein L3
MQGHFKKADLPPCRVLREFRVEDADDVKVGDKLSVEMFEPGESVQITGVSKGKGFQGVVKRHHFRGGAATHGSMFHRAPGSIGASAFPSRVLKGMRAAGHMGQDQVTLRNVKIVRIEKDKNIVLVRGAVPGANDSYVVIRKK